MTQQKKIHVLVVEDNIIAQHVAKSILTGLGCEVTIASTGAQAIQFAAEKAYELIFMDFGLPDIDGVQVALTIKNKGNIAPIVALTAHQNDALRQQCQQVGFKKYMVKPLTVEGAQAVLKDFCCSSLGDDYYP